jgi:hypothetical protein
MPLNEEVMINNTMVLNHLHNKRAKKLDNERREGPAGAPPNEAEAEDAAIRLQPTYLAMCVVVRDEPELLLEWLMYHHSALVRSTSSCQC